MLGYILAYCDKYRIWCISYSLESMLYLISHTRYNTYQMLYILHHMSYLICRGRGVLAVLFGAFLVSNDGRFAEAERSFCNRGVRLISVLTVFLAIHLHGFLVTHLEAFDSSANTVARTHRRWRHDVRLTTAREREYLVR